MSKRLDDERDGETGVPAEENDGVLESVHDTAGDVAREANRGRTARAPFIALSGVILTVAAVVAVVLAIALLAYFLA